MKTAKEMFEELGYEVERCWGYSLSFKKDMNTLKTKHIRFSINGITIVIDDVVRRDNYVVDLSSKEVQAINQMCKELGWFDE